MTFVQISKKRPLIPRTLQRLEGAPWPSALLLALVALSIYRARFTWGFVPVYREGDESIFLEEAMRIARGEHIYRDFFEFVFPGTPQSYSLIFRLVGPRYWIPGVTMIALGVLLAWFCLRIAGQVTTKRAALSIALVYAGVVILPGRDATHHWFSAALVMASVWAVIERRTPTRLATAGGLCGLAAWFTQTRGAISLAVIAVFVAWEFWEEGQTTRELAKREAALCGAFVLVLALLLTPVVADVGLSTFAADTYVFPVKYYRAVGFNNADGFFSAPVQFQSDGASLVLIARSVQEISLLLFLAVAYPIAAFRILRNRRFPQDVRCRLTLLLLLGLANLAVALLNGNTFRLSIDAWIAAALFLAVVSPEKKSNRLLSLGLCVIGVVSLLQPLRPRSLTAVQLPSGQVAFRGSPLDKFRAIKEHVKAGEYMLDTANVSYFWLQTRNAAPVPFLTNTDYTRPVQVERLLDNLSEKRVRYILWSAGYLDGAASPGDHLQPLRDYVRGFRVVTSFDDGDRLLERDDSAPR